MSHGNKVITNTLVLYSQLFLQLAIGMFTTRLVLQALGEVDYGVYMLVAGVIGMLAFLQSTMATASMRFIAISIGTGDEKLIKQTFNTTLYVHIILAVMLVILIEIGGHIMFENFLNIPEERLNEAKIVFHFMVITTFVSIISVPFDAIIQSYEDFTALSIIELAGAFLRLIGAIFINYLDANILVIYGFYMMIIQIVIRIIKQLYVRRKYDESAIQIADYKDRTMIKRLLSFSGWKILDAGSSVLYVQIKSILLNVFFGVLLNAANGIAVQMSGHLNNFSTNMTKALNPQVIKSEGGGDRDRMLRLTTVSAKFAVYLFALFCIPVVLETKTILNIWLTTVPEYAPVFSQLILINMLIQKYTFSITIAIQAVGKIRKITFFVLFNVLTQLFATYYLFSKGAPPYTIYIVGIVMAFFSAGVRLYFGKTIAGLEIKKYLFDVAFMSSAPLFIATIMSIIPVMMLNPGLLRLLVVTIVFVTSALFFIRIIGLKNEELIILKKYMLSIKNKFHGYKRKYD